MPRGWEPGQGAVVTAQVKGAKDLLGGSRDQVKRADGETLQKYSRQHEGPDWLWTVSGDATDQRDNSPRWGEDAQ